MFNYIKFYSVVLKRFIIILFLFIPSYFLSAQKLAVKTNLLSDVALSPNLGIELIANRHLSFVLNGCLNQWDIPMKEMKFFTINPQVKYWFQRPLCRFFVGAELIYIDNDLKIKNTGYQGDCKGGGIFAGYDWVLSNRWNLEVSLGCGVVYANQYKYEGQRGTFEINYQKWLPMPTSCAVSFIYIIK